MNKKSRWTNQFTPSQYFTLLFLMHMNANVERKTKLFFRHFFFGLSFDAEFAFVHSSKPLMQKEDVTKPNIVVAMAFFFCSYFPFSRSLFWSYFLSTFFFFRRRQLFQFQFFSVLCLLYRRLRRHFFLVSAKNEIEMRNRSERPTEQKCRKKITIFFLLWKSF